MLWVIPVFSLLSEKTKILVEYIAISGYAQEKLDYNIEMTLTTVWGSTNTECKN